MPLDDIQRRRYARHLVLDGVGVNQRESTPFNHDWPETNSANNGAKSLGGFTYAFLKGMRLGLLDKATYMPVAEKAYQGLLNTFIREREGRTDIIQVCASAGLGPAKNPSRTGTTNYYLCGKDVTMVENEGKAIGTFIMASVEYEDMQRQAK